jgi:hypothetical protein
VRSAYSGDVDQEFRSCRPVAERSDAGVANHTLKWSAWAEKSGFWVATLLAVPDHRHGAVSWSVLCGVCSGVCSELSKIRFSGRRGGRFPPPPRPPPQSWRGSWWAPGWKGAEAARAAHDVRPSEGPCDRAHGFVPRAERSLRWDSPWSSSR